MGEQTGIAWTDHTFNSWIGCTAVSAACGHCYAGTMAKRYGWDFAARRRTSPANWRKPLAWNKAAMRDGVRRRVFCASLADVFDNQVPEEWRADLFNLIRACPALDWQLLTKRPQNIVKMLPPDWCDGWRNVWLGTTAEDQTEYDRRWPHLARIPAAVRFVSYEPALGPLDPGDADVLPDWIIVGGESGARARPMPRAYVDGVRAWCDRAGVPLFVKQVGSRPGADWPAGITGKGDDPAEWQSELRVQQFPTPSPQQAQP